MPLLIEGGKKGDLLGPPDLEGICHSPRETTRMGLSFITAEMEEERMEGRREEK